MRVLGLVVARGGSKRIPNKNLRLLGDRPLVRWTIDTALAVPGLCDVLVSTDDAAIGETAAAAGALVPWLRPEALATDTASSVDVALHALDWYEGEYGPVDGLLLLQPTSPFRSVDTVVRGIAAFDWHGRRPVIAVAPAADHPMWTFRVEGDLLVPFVERAAWNVRSQDLPAAYVATGALYIIMPKDLRDRRSFYSPDALPLIVTDPAENLDIDTLWDWSVAEAVVASRSHAGK